MSELGNLTLAALALAGSPGPNTLSLAAVGAAFGRQRGMAYLAGLTLGMVVVIAITGTGVSTLVMALPGVAPVITGLAVCYFLWLAWRIATAPPIDKVDSAAMPPRWFEGALLSTVNPKAYAATAAVFSGFTVIPDAPLQDGLAKTVTVMAVILFVNICWLTVGASLTRAFQNPRSARAINLSFAAALLLSVAAATLL
ncbi:LysE family translocator [Primorskyibacter sp. 2E233]|uniref:LysE family translocator n=1 Tax=Primorskyibacter sp. 2E233 TaxID=3413431 RepID=UPI003BF23FC8